MKHKTDNSQLNPWPNFTGKSDGNFVVERKRRFIFKRTNTWVVVPMGSSTMTLSYSNSNSVNTPWWGTSFISGEDSGSSYTITCMTIPYRSSKALTFKVHKKRGRSWVPKVK